MRRICVYCGSNTGARPDYRVAAERLGRLLAERRLGLVYGGGNIGLMGVVADAVLAAGGEAIGVIPRGFVEKEVAHDGLSDLRIVSSMHERKAMMADLADAFVALPGGLGTLEEMFETWTWGQLGLHAKPCGLLDVAGYYEPLLAFLDHAAAEGFIKPRHRALLLAERDPGALLDRLAAFRPPRIEKWLDRETL
jgi:hypothetical protein